MVNRISRCNICGEFFKSKKELRSHKSKEHRISAPKIMASMKKVTGLSSFEEGSMIIAENDELE
jgi:uncharacterized Zn finger protein